MKQFFTFALVLAAAASTLSAGNNKGYLLVKTEVTDFAEYTNYEWNTENLQATQKEADNGEYLTRETYTYDEEGRIVKEAGWQFIYDDFSDEGAWYRTSDVFTTYDEQGRPVTMTVVNYYRALEGEELRPMSVTPFTFTYNDKGNIEAMNIYACSALDTPQSEWRDFQNIEYTYDENDRLKSRAWYIHSIYGGGSELSVRQLYYYYADGRLAIIQQTTPLEGMEVVSSHRVYVYNEDTSLNNVYDTGSTFRFDVADNGEINIISEGRVMKRQEFVYDEDVPFTNVRYPKLSLYQTEYLGDFVMELLKGKVIMETLYERPQEDDAELEVYSEIDYKFIEVENPEFPELVGIETIDNQASANFSAEVLGGMLVLSGNTTDNVRIYDLQGRVMQNAVALNGQVNVSNLQNGVYVVAAGSQVAKFVR